MAEPRSVSVAHALCVWTVFPPPRAVDRLYRRTARARSAILGAIADVLGRERGALAGDEDAAGAVTVTRYAGAAHSFASANANSGDHAWTYVDDDDAGDDDVVGIDEGAATRGACAFAHQDAPGLQLRGADGAWVDAPVTPDLAFLVGDGLERATGGELRATPYRVVRRSEPRNAVLVGSESE